MSKIRLNCMVCGRKIKLDFDSVKAMCKKCKKVVEKPLVYDPFFVSE